MSARIWADDEARAIASTVVASLPLSLEWAHKDADVLVLGGSGGWTRRAATAMGSSSTQAAVIVSPSPTPPYEVRKLRMAAGGTPVLIDNDYMSDPAVQTLWSWRPDGPGLLECTVAAPLNTDPYAGLLDAALFLGTAFGALPLVSSAIVERDRIAVAGGLCLAGVRGVASLRVILTDSLEPSLCVSWVSATNHLRATLYPSETARPALVHLSDDDGETLLPTLYESGHRASVRRLLKALDAGGATDDLDDLLDALTFVDEVRAQASVKAATL
ncbi:hypothetical protein GCM10023169_29890 [Georgenia halophila]|uniref:Uncharacterized protein n=1 Tax=Georgenia halophila TaxID=620889 RepID=A0ABP8LHN2_9MICO